MFERKMKKNSPILASGLLLLAMAGTAHGEMLDLGSFNQQIADEKLFQDMDLKLYGSSFKLSADEIRKVIQEKEVMAYNPAYKSEIENTDFCAVRKSSVCGLLFSVQKEIHIQKISNIYLDEDSLSRFLEDLSRQTDKDPRDARLQIQDGKVSVFSLSENGIKANTAKNLDILVDYFKRKDGSGTVTLAYDEIKPAIPTDSIENLGIKSLIGEGVSNFAGSPKNRIFNIKVASERFNGILIKPGEEFSFVKTLGDVDGEHGYLPELVIKQNKTEPDFGGGICQVSTTAFRAAIRSGLKITARTPHAYPVSYYNPQGMDATVYVPNPDLKFINNTPGHILIQTTISGTQLVFDFYGNNDGRKVTITGPTTTERNSDGSLKASFTQEVIDKNGSQVINDLFNSAYESPSKFPHPGQVLAKKPADWSEKKWRAYKKEHNL